MNPMLLLDPDQMSRLESVLQSDEARNFLGEVPKAVRCFSLLILIPTSKQIKQGKAYNFTKE